MSLPWLRVDPPRRVVVYVGDGDRDAAKRSVDAAWANRAVREAFWLFLGADAAPGDVSALIREVHARGVADVVAAGAGRGAAVVSAVECEPRGAHRAARGRQSQGTARLGLLRERGRPVLGRRRRSGVFAGIDADSTAGGGGPRALRLRIQRLYVTTT